MQDREKTPPLYKQLYDPMLRFLPYIFLGVITASYATVSAADYKEYGAYGNQDALGLFFKGGYEIGFGGGYGYLANKDDVHLMYFEMLGLINLYSEKPFGVGLGIRFYGGNKAGKFVLAFLVDEGPSPDFAAVAYGGALSIRPVPYVPQLRFIAEGYYGSEPYNYKSTSFKDYSASMRYEFKGKNSSNVYLSLGGQRIEVHEEDGQILQIINGVYFGIGVGLW